MGLDGITIFISTFLTLSLQLLFVGSNIYFVVNPFCISLETSDRRPEISTILDQFLH